MKAGIINIGDELLIGQTINTNASWLGNTLGQVGIPVKQSFTIEDSAEDISNALKLFLDNEAITLIIITGGLGPTNDDITKETLAQFFNTSLTENQEVLNHIENIFHQKGKELLSINRQQSLVPKNAHILFNRLGTAPGMWFDYNDKIIIALPGVPYEMQALITESVIPLLQDRYELEGKYHQTIMVQGIGESALANKIKKWEREITAKGLHLAYLPSPGIIKLRLNSDNGKKDSTLITQYLAQLIKMLPEYIYADHEVSIYETVSSLLKEKKLTLGTVESCTGGNIARSFISIPGASNFFKGSLITYSNELKMKLANVDPLTIKKFGAVSKNVVCEMAEEGKKQLNVNYCLAISGIAGPGGGTPSKPVGTVWVAIATPQKTYSQLFNLGNNRIRTIDKTGLYAINLLRKIILNLID